MPSLIKIYSHPRSGTHFLESFLARNFYNDMDLSIKPIRWGHWSDRRLKKDGKVYGKLFGDHNFKPQSYTNPSIYIFRDGRAVALSLWKSDGFNNPKYSNISFSRFLRLNLDWHGTPGRKKNSGLNIVQHWYKHVTNWHSICKNNDSIMMIRYEDLKTSPEQMLDNILANFDWLERPKSFDPIADLVGLEPNKGKIYEWKKYFKDTDLHFFHSYVPDSSNFIIDIED